MNFHWSIHEIEILQQGTHMTNARWCPHNFKIFYEKQVLATEKERLKRDCGIRFIFLEWHDFREKTVIKQQQKDFLQNSHTSKVTVEK